MNIKEIKEILVRTIPDSSISKLENSTPPGFEIKSEHLIQCMTLLNEHEELYFDMLSCLTGIDNGPEQGTMEVVYHLYSIPYDQSLTIKVVLDRANPTIESVAHIWQTAIWHEREAFDLLGIHFNNHPDLRRILLPTDWEGHPLRKDYSTQEYYHGVKVDY